MSVKLSLSDDTLIGIGEDATRELPGELVTAIAAAEARHEAQVARPDLRPELAAFIADVQTEAHQTGILGFTHEMIQRCPLGCGKTYGYLPYESGPNRGLYNRKKPRHYQAIDLSAAFVRIRGHVRLGGCQDCYTEVKPHLVRALAGIEVQLPDALLADDATERWFKSDNIACPRCEWTGHRRQLGKLRTLMGDGFYFGKCPGCGHEAAFPGEQFKHTDGFTMVSEARS